MPDETPGMASLSESLTQSHSDRSPYLRKGYPCGRTASLHHAVHDPLANFEGLEPGMRTDGARVRVSYATCYDREFRHTETPDTCYQPARNCNARRRRRAQRSGARSLLLLPPDGCHDAEMGRVRASTGCSVLRCMWARTSRLIKHLVRCLVVALGMHVAPEESIS
ncbi:hypothetical protein M011DRAFT_53317 [Sporormia fimetaria CBS 119925]|uniref:Uncharacterized protein n=1 Tax=Sporormia fimetaria CBS 119925 TaxID=1340428 RepID=A0A6A6VCG0_9PLEO|nr:hypothetical protein M011DRAFT_53317 [Sporormia fimetaria CBS 119925]